MGTWLKKFSERAQVSTDSVDIVSDEISGSIQNSTDSADTMYTMSGLSVWTQAHSESISFALNDVGNPAGPCPDCGSCQY